MEKDFFPQTVYGIDEAGRGPLAGPLSLALVNFSREQLNEIHSQSLFMGLNDSKQLSSRKRKSLHTQIQSSAFYKHVFVSNKSIDRFGISFCIFRAIIMLIREIDLKDSILLVDGNYKFEKYFKSYRNFPYQSIIGGDSKVASIAAASIVAKENRDRYMVNLSSKYPQYGFETHMGYGTKKHLENIKKFGISRYHRRSYIHDAPDEPMLFK